MPNDLVSVIIPTYGRQGFLLDAVASVVAQSYRPIELIVVDDCSPEPVELPEMQGLDVRLVRHDRNMGPGAARNTGLAHASGEFVRFLDDDDELLPETVAISVAGISGGRIHVMPSNVNDRLYSGDMTETLHHDLTPSTAQVLLRRADVVQFDPSLRVSEDVEWWIRMRDSALFAWDDRMGVRIRRHDADRPGVNAEVRFRCRSAIIERHLSSLDRRSRAHHLNRAASSALVAGHRPSAMLLGARSFVSMPSQLSIKVIGRSLLPWRWSAGWD